MRGESTNLSPAKRAMTVIARTVSNCWRFLVCMAFGWVPMKVKGKLHTGGLAACHADIHIGDSVNGAQPLQRFEQGLVVTGDTRAGHQIQIADFEGLGGEAAIFWKALSQ